MLDGLLMGAFLAAATQSEWDALRMDVSAIRETVADIREWMGRVDERYRTHERRLDDLDRDQAQFVKDCRANHAVMAPPLRAAENGVTRTQAVVVGGLILSAVIPLVKGCWVVLTWMFEHLKRP